MPKDILLVETDPAVRGLLRTALGRRGLATREAGTGPAAVARLAADPAGIGAVIVGELIPGLDGVALAETLAVAAPGVGLFFFCGDSVPPDLFHLPGVEVFLKPHGLAELCQVVAALLDAGPGGGGH